MKLLGHPLVAAVLVSAAGFGVMTVLNLLGLGEPSARGQWDYLAGTIGDAVLLPAMTGLLLYVHETRRSVVAIRASVLVGAGAGGVVGAGVQALWLLDPSPELNWTLPEPHTFNLPGWYHAGFFVVMSSILGGLTLAAAGRLRRTAGEGASIEPFVGPVAGLFALAACFCGLLVTDTVRDVSTLSVAGSLAACAGALLLAAAALTGTRSLRRLRRPAIAAAAAGFAAAGVITALRSVVIR